MQLRWGIISQFDPEKYLAKVEFKEDQVVSPWLQVLTFGSLDNKIEIPLDKNELVACLVDRHMQRGVVLGTAYSNEDVPDKKNTDVMQVKFKDGTLWSYDRSSHTMTIKNGETEWIITREGHTVKKSSETLKKILTDLLDAILQLTVTTPMGPSGVPINAATFTQIKQRLPQLFEN